MYRITYDYKNFVNQTISLEDKDVANQIWQALKTLPDVRNMKHSTDKPSEQPKKIAVQVVFRSYGKRYTYLSKSKVSAGDTVVVWTADGRELVQVVECMEMTDAQLEKLCPLNKLKYIDGVVRAA